MDLYILKRGKTPIGLEGFVIVLDQYVLLLSLEYTEPSCHYLIGSTLAASRFLGQLAQFPFIKHSGVLRCIPFSHNN